MNKKIILSFTSLFLLTGCSFDEVMKSLEEYNNVEMIISVIIVIGLVIAILTRLFTKGSGDHEREYNKQEKEKLQRYTEQQTNNNNIDNSSFDIENNGHVNNVPSNGNLDFEFYSDNGVVVDTTTNVIENNQNKVDNVVNSNQSNTNSINSVPLINEAQSNNLINNVPLVNENQNNNQNVGFNDLANNSNTLENNSDGPVIRINNQSVVVSKNENE